MRSVINLIDVSQTGVNGLLDAARRSFKECSEDIVTHVQDLSRKLQAHTFC